MLISPFFLLSLIKHLDDDDRKLINAQTRGKIFYNTLCFIKNANMNLRLASYNNFMNEVYSRLSHYFLSELNIMNDYFMRETNQKESSRVVGIICDCFGIKNGYALQFLDENKDKISLRFSQQTEERVEIKRTNGFYKVEYIGIDKEKLSTDFNIQKQIDFINQKMKKILTLLDNERRSRPDYRKYDIFGYVDNCCDLKNGNYFFGDNEEFKGVDPKTSESLNANLLAFNLYKALISKSADERASGAFVKLYGSHQEAMMKEEYLR